MPHIFRYTETTLQKKLLHNDLLGHATAQHYPTALYRYKKRSMEGVPEHFDFHTRNQSHRGQPTLEAMPRIYGDKSHAPTYLHNC
ncbi:hypothetical protein PITCH_A230050 [uncultured Desulfobacterium sp.]|uniref:Uncharacterized protein n=1 Tax=uncultured Desulfobacterium sp. TaxID=201089 RepID=A0A445MXW0_9BACT|nr:hypothetical protein PITCH_A230050 [uncultured Desulfobacterium sp.]